MLYYYLAESFSELDQLVYLVREIEDTESPLHEPDDNNFLLAEVQRIKSVAVRDILVFHEHWREYLRTQLILIYDLWIRVMEIMISLPEQVIMGEQERYKYKYCLALREELEKLEAFFLQLNNFSMDN
ncbi:MAG TPA: hypothetical protein VGC08_03215 [Pedobacter sp.]|jgi:hypothetical protein